MSSAAEFYALLGGLIGTGVAIVCFLYLHLRKKWREDD